MRNKVNLLQLSFMLLGLIAITAIISCNKQPAYTPVSFKRTEISDFWLEKTSSNSTINRPYQGMIKGDTIRLMVDFGIDITALEPTIFADVDSISPKGKQNFSNPIRYTLWANGSSATYTVSIKASTIQAPVFTAIAAGSNHLLGLKNDGTVWVCGDNSSGQLGLGDYSSRIRLTQVPVYDAEQIFTGEAASIIKLKDGSTWGSGNQFGQLGIGNKNPISSLVRTPFLDNATQLAITSGEVIALKPDGSVWGAGRNLTKILAQGDNELRATFVRIPITDVKQLKGTGLAFVAQKNNGEVWGWGLNHAGQLGLGDNNRREIPVLLPTPSNGITKIFVSGGVTFLIDNGGKVWAAGANAAGQMGLGDFVNRSSFTPLPFFDNKSLDIINARTGGTNFLELNGSMWNVGNNVFGQMGLGIKSQPYTTPTQLTGFIANQISGSGETIYALKPDGTVWAWGNNSSGELGTGLNITESSSPIQIK